MHAVRAVISVAALSLSLSSSAQPWPDKYDLLIKREVRRYLPGVDWQRLKAQLAVESALIPDAISPVGAGGLAQIMPNTAMHLSRPLGYQVNPFNPRHAIEAGAYYMGWLRGQWKWKRPDWDRQVLAESSYNAGLKHILSAQKRCNSAVLYKDIIKCLPSVTGHHAQETIQYVQRIEFEYRRIQSN